MSSLRKLLLPAALTLILAACGKDEAPPAATPAAAPVAASVAPAAAAGPAESVKAMAAAMKQSDLPTLVRLALPKAQYEKVKADFEKNMAEKEITEAERTEFADNLAKLTAPGAVDELMKQIEPQLAQMKPQMAGMIAMGLGAAQMGLQNPENKDLTETQKAQAMAVINGMQGWATSTDFADAAKLRAALTNLADAAKATGVTSLDQIKAMKFEEALAKGSILFGGFKQALNQYGFNLDEMADSMTAEVLSTSGDTAKVKSTFTLFGTPISSESEMVKIDGSWYSKDSIDSLAKMAEADSSSSDASAEGDEDNAVE